MILQAGDELFDRMALETDLINCIKQGKPVEKQGTLTIKRD